MHHDQTDAIPCHWQRRTIVSAIAAALAPGWTHSSYAQEQNENESERLEEVIVTARKMWRKHHRPLQRFQRFAGLSAIQ